MTQVRFKIVNTQLIVHDDYCKNKFLFPEKISNEEVIVWIGFVRQYVYGVEHNEEVKYN